MGPDRTATSHLGFFPAGVPVITKREIQTVYPFRGVIACHHSD